jgi:hypothetical protein
MEIQNECEATVAVFVAVIGIDGKLTEFEIDKISGVLAQCRRFSNYDLNHSLRRVFHLKEQYSIEDLIRMAVPLIGDDFIKTFYAVLCDVLCSDGRTSDTDIELLAMVALELNLEEDEYLPIAKTFMIRHAWNIHLE